jgi:hypothetical protein
VRLRESGLDLERWNLLGGGCVTPGECLSILMAGMAGREDMVMVAVCVCVRAWWVSDDSCNAFLTANDYISWLCYK